MLFLHYRAAIAPPHWDGNCVLFEITDRQTTVRRTISRAALDLNNRADDAETDAFAVFDLAIASTDEAAQAALEALLAHRDATGAALPIGARVSS